MKVVIDTSSLVSLVRYYLGFDFESKVSNLIKSKIESGEIILIKEVHTESKYTSKGIVVKELDYLVDKEWNKEFGVPTKTDEIFPPSLKKFHNILDNQLINAVAKRMFTEEEYEIMKENFMKSADCRMIIYCLDFKHKNPNEDIYIVTEETITSNDNKAFKKIPAIGKILNIDVINLPTLISMYPEIEIKF